MIVSGIYELISMNDKNQSPNTCNQLFVQHIGTKTPQKFPMKFFTVSFSLLMVQSNGPTTSIITPTKTNTEHVYQQTNLGLRLSISIFDQPKSPGINFRPKIDQFQKIMRVREKTTLPHIRRSPSMWTYVKSHVWPAIRDNV